MRGFEPQSMILSISIGDGNKKWWVQEVGGGRDAIVEVESGTEKNEWGEGHLLANASSRRAVLGNGRAGGEHVCDVVDGREGVWAAGPV